MSDCHDFPSADSFITRRPLLVRWHDEWRQDGRSAEFAWKVAERYDLATLAEFLSRGRVAVRRAAVAAIGMLGDDRWSWVLGQRLSDPHRGVRLDADRWIGRLWHRITPVTHRGRLSALTRRLCHEPRSVLAELDNWERIATRHAVVWQLRGDALMRLQHAEEAAECYRIACQLDRFRYPAMAAHAALLEREGRETAAAWWYRRALQVFPDMPGIRGRVRRLQQRRR